LPQRQRSQHRLLFCNEGLHSLAGQPNHFSQLLLVEYLVLRRSLDFDQLAAGGHDEIHVHVGA